MWMQGCEKDKLFQRAQPVSSQGRPVWTLTTQTAQLMPVSLAHHSPNAEVIQEQEAQKHMALRGLF